MRTNELHACVKQVQRSSGRSSVAAAAYRSGERLYDERAGVIHDYTQKSGVEFTRIYLPDNAPEKFRERSTLWNAVESKENRKNSCTAREFEIAFPCEFNAMQRREAGDRVARELMNRYNCAVDIAYHAPNSHGDERNFHAHILFTTRGFDEDRADGWSKNKYRDLNNDQIQVEGESVTRGRLEVNDLREFTADQMNRIAERDGLEVKTEHLSFEARGIDRQPTQKMGYMATQLERRGIRTERGDINRAIIASNDNLGETTAQLQKQKKVLLFEKECALLALEQEEGNSFSGNEVAGFGRQEGFQFHQKRVKDAGRELAQAKEKLESISVLERMMGKKALYEAELQDKEESFREAQKALESIKNNEIVRAQEENVAQQMRITEERTAQYQQDLAQEKEIQEEFGRKNNIDKIIDAITGKTREQRACLEELQSNIRFYEADKRLEEIRQRQIEQRQREEEARERDQARANDNAEKRKAEFLERREREREEEAKRDKDKDRDRE